MRVYVVRKWSLRGRSRFVCWNITRVSLCRSKADQKLNPVTEDSLPIEWSRRQSTKMRKKWVSWHVVTHKFRSSRIWIFDIAHTKGLFLHLPQLRISLTVTWMLITYWSSKVSEQYGQLTHYSLQPRYSLPSPLRSARFKRVSGSTSPWAKEKKNDFTTQVQHI
jgi:hypothetical protein